MLLKQNIKAYLISHAHLDHISGLVIGSTIDSHKEIFGIDPTIEYLRHNIFNWKIWPNFPDEGGKPLLKKYHYHHLLMGKTTPIPHTELSVKAFLLNHGNDYPSTAFLLEKKGYYILYFGDTGADPVEHSHDIRTIWNEIAPLIRKHKIKVIFIEASCPNDTPDNLLFGHLTPHWLLTELTNLAKIVNPSQPSLALKGLPIIITHIKQGLGNEQMSEKIKKQLDQGNNLGVEFIIPRQGQLLRF